MQIFSPCPFLSEPVPCTLLSRTHGITTASNRLASFGNKIQKIGVALAGTLLLFNSEQNPGRVAEKEAGVQG